MRIKKYIANSLQEGKSKILKELGEDAIILSSRNFKKPGEPNTNYVEIVAAVDNSPIIQKSNILNQKSMIQETGKSEQLEDKSYRDYLKTTNLIYNEIDNLKEMITDISDNIKYRYSSSLGPVFGDLFKILINADISEEESLKIIGQISSLGSIKDLKNAKEQARKIITKDLIILETPKKEAKTKTAIFIGPTGTGKTTTIIKIAIICKLVLNAKVLLISSDTNKVSGIEQLQTFASIATIPFLQADTPEELKRKINDSNDFDFIFVDTTGGSQRNKEHLLSLKEFIDIPEWDYVYLTLSCTTNLSTMKEIIEKYSLLKPNALILTKFDEATTYGTLLEGLKKCTIPLAYFTTGQQIPEDIEPASKKKLGELVLQD